MFVIPLHGWRGESKDVRLPPLMGLKVYFALMFIVQK